MLVARLQTEYLNQPGNVYLVRNTGWPKGREPYGHGVPIVVVGVTTYQGERESRSQGEGEQVNQISRINEERRDANVS
jgi:hypothetical protein